MTPEIAIENLIKEAIAFADNSTSANAIVVENTKYLILKSIHGWCDCGMGNDCPHYGDLQHD